MSFLVLDMLKSYRCSHSDKAGQELCYLCHQRSQKNIPVYFTEERRQRELEQDRLLQQYQQQKDTEAILKEQVLTELLYLVKSFKGQKETVRRRLIFIPVEVAFCKAWSPKRWSGVKLSRETRS